MPPPLHSRFHQHRPGKTGTLGKCCRIEVFAALNLLLLWSIMTFAKVDPEAAPPSFSPLDKLRLGIEKEEAALALSQPPKLLHGPEEMFSALMIDPLPLSPVTLRGRPATVGRNSLSASSVVGNSVTDAAAIPAPMQQNPPAKPPGVVILGMHRSGTSLLAGLLFRSGLFVGERRDLIWGADATDNSKGFYERSDIVLQNDALMKAQKVHWSLFGDRFSVDQARADLEAKSIDWGYGMRGLAALNDPRHSPWALKDPRLCLSLDFWVPLLTSPSGTKPAAIFTYRHPVEVARSLQKREKFGMRRGLLLWLVYNQKALEQAKNLCLVATSNAAINAAPLDEVRRVAWDLEAKCGLVLPRTVTTEAVLEFVDAKLQRNTVARAASCDPLAPWESFGILNMEGQPDTAVTNAKREVLREAMSAFCDLESGRAFKPGAKPFYEGGLNWG